MRYAARYWAVLLAIIPLACNSTRAPRKPVSESAMDAGKSLPRDAAMPDEQDAGPDRPAADGGTDRPSVHAQKKSDCKLFGPLFGDDRSWTLARCGDQIGTLALADLKLTARGTREGQLIEAALGSDHVIYIDQYNLWTLPLAGGPPKQLALDVYGINALTPDKRHAVVEAKDDQRGYYHQLIDVTGVEAGFDLSVAGSLYWFEAISADGSRVFLRNAVLGKPVRVRSVQLAGAVTTELGDAALSVDAMKFAVLDTATGSITVSFVDGTAPTTWHEAGYKPTRIVSFTRDASALILDDPDGTRTVALDGSTSVRLASVPTPPAPSSRIGTAALFRWCEGQCRGESGRFNVVPLDGGAAQSSEIGSCNDVPDRVVKPLFSESGDQAVFLDRQHQLVLADARTATSSVVATNVDARCLAAAYGLSKDGSKAFATGSFGVRIVDAMGKVLGSFPGADTPLFSPSTRRVSALFGNELQIIALGSGEVLYRASLTGDLSATRDERDRFSWVDEDRFIYDDANTIYLVQL